MPLQLAKSSRSQVIQEQQKAKPKPVKQASKPKTTPVAAAAAAPPPSATPQAAESGASTEGVQYADPAESNLVKMSPLSGSEIPVEKVAGSVYQMNSTDIERTRAAILQDALLTQVPGLIIGDLQGNQFQTDIQFRGFEASPVNGVAQGLAVYQNGVRINESFGDIINWDFLPTNAINNEFPRRRRRYAVRFVRPQAGFDRSWVPERQLGSLRR